MSNTQKGNLVSKSITPNPPGWELLSSLRVGDTLSVFRSTFYKTKIGPSTRVITRVVRVDAQSITLARENGQRVKLSKAGVLSAERHGWLMTIRFAKGSILGFVIPYPISSRDYGPDADVLRWCYANWLCPGDLFSAQYKGADGLSIVALGYSPQHAEQRLRARIAAPTLAALAKDRTYITYLRSDGSFGTIEVPILIDAGQVFLSEAEAIRVAEGLAKIHSSLTR